MTDLAIDECDECGGAGSFDEPAAAAPTRIVCRTCHGNGFVWRTADEAGEEWITQEVPAPAPSLNHGGPGICTLCHPPNRGLFA